MHVVYTSGLEAAAWTVFITAGFSEVSTPVCIEFIHLLTTVCIFWLTSPQMPPPPSPW